ncbi:corticoliberin-like [Antennarius striatus]|uniref:corticoliberin-like n=1 Tax=Antennarius striatus TaxID=241820 RepID=UPI0035B33EE1
MKPNVVVLLFVVFLTCSADGRPDSTDQRPLLPRPLLLHLGEELSLRLGGATPDVHSSVNRALWRLLQVRAEQRDQLEEEEEEEEEKGKRSEESPTSLDLTFHLLREVLEMARAEKIAQQADSNRKMMDSFGK